MNDKAHLRPKDFDSSGDIIPTACKEENDMIPVGTTVHINPEDIKWECNGGDLINREALKKAIEEYKYCGFYDKLIEIIDNAPTLEAYTEEDMKRTIKENFDIGYEMAKNKYERPQGEWIIESELRCLYYCSNCRSYGYRHQPFCGWCGADMRGDKK